jgi:hypothetical protein
MSPNREMTYVQINEQVTLQNQDPVLNECAARLGVSLSMFWGYKTLPEYLGKPKSNVVYGNQRELVNNWMNRGL